jgi:hypothetical protein
MAREIDDYRCLDISKLRGWGYLTPDPNTAFKQGVITWERQGETVAQITIGARMADASPSVAVLYMYRGEKKAYKIQLDFTPSNLPNHAGTGYYYFVCPVTGYRCRKLYLVNGVFMSRRAFRPLYPVQAMSRKARGGYRVIDKWLRIDDEERASRYRKTHYRGNPTPYTLRMERLYRGL